MNKIQIVGLQNSKKLKDYIDSALIDIAYVDEINEDSMIISLDATLNIKNQDDKDWLYQLLKKSFDQYQESEATIIEMS